MLVYPDSSDLIRIERDDGRLAEQLAEWLRERAARLVLSSTVIAEVAQPLHAMRSAKVMTLCNRLDALPHIWLRSVDLEERELETAIRCYAAGQAWEPVAPFVGSYVDTAMGMDPFLQDYYRHRPLAEVVWEELHGRSLIPNVAPATARFTGWLAENRAAILATDDAEYHRQLRLAFRRTVLTKASMLHGFRTIDADAFVGHL